MCFRKIHFLRCLALGAALLLMLSCGDDDNGEPDNQNDEQNQQNQQNQGENQELNQNQNNGEPVEFYDDCHQDAHGAGHFQVPIPAGYDEAYYARAIRVGDELWVSFVAVADPGEVEQAHLVRLSCGGEALDEPMRLGGDDVQLEAGGAMAADDETVYVLWRSQAADGVETRGRTFDLDGQPRQGESFFVEAHVDGEAMMMDYPDIAVDHHGDAVVVGETNVEGDIVVALQRIDDGGAPVGDGFFLDDEADDMQIEPVIERMSDNHFVFAYLEVEGFGPGSVYHGTVRHDGNSVDAGPTAAEPAIGGGNLSQSIRLSTSPGGSTWMTYPRGSAGENTVVIREAAQLGPGVGDATTRVTGRTSNYVDVSASDTGGAIAWISGSTLSGRIHFQRFSGSGIEVYDLGPIIDEHDENDATAPFGPDIVWLYDDVYAAVWNERDDGEMVVVGRVLDFSEFEEDDE